MDRASVTAVSVGGRPAVATERRALVCGGPWKASDQLSLLADDARGAQVRLGDTPCYVQAKNKIGIRCVQDLASASFCQWSFVHDVEDCRVMQMDTSPRMTA